MHIYSPQAAVCGAGGFIGGHLVKGLLKQGVRVIRAVDVKPLKDWHQITNGIENLSLDLKENQNSFRESSGAHLSRIFGAFRLHAFAADRTLPGDEGSFHFLHYLIKIQAKCPGQRQNVNQSRRINVIL